MKQKITITLLMSIFVIGAVDAQHNHSHFSGEHSGHSNDGPEKVEHEISDYDSYRTDSFTVYGNCGMCEKTIETSVAGVKGIAHADWNKETDIMIVMYNSKLISLNDIKQRIANVGYDTDTHRANKETYDALPGCCQYERPEQNKH